MELVMGGHLQARLQGGHYYEEHRARLLFAQVVEAVHYLHDLNITHRDVKPENILFASKNDELTVKLTDFGLSTMKEGRLTTRCGTPSYCAPELLAAAGYGKSVDMWSLGVLAYVVLTGVLPFVGSDRADLFKRIQKGQYEFRPEHSARLSQLAKDLISRLLRLQPMERYSARETLQHPWLQGGEAGTGAEHSGEEGGGHGEPVQHSLDTVHEMMRRFNAERRWRRAGRVVIACRRFRRAGLGLDRYKPHTGAAAALPVSGWSDDTGEPSEPSPPLVHSSSLQ
jgi:hypothetical protein